MRPNRFFSFRTERRLCSQDVRRGREAAINIRQIEIFRAIMEAGSVTAAARRLNLAQPSVSKHLRLLETRLGVPLFQRTGNRLVPRPEAHALFAQVDRVYAGLDQLGRFADNLRHHRQGEVMVAAMPLVAHRWLPAVVAGFLARHDGVSVSLPVRSSHWINRSVAAGRVDLGIALSIGGEQGVLRELLLDLPLVCVVPEGHRLARAATVAARDLDDESLITLSNFDSWRLAVEHTLETHRVRLRRRVDTFTTHVACELACRGVGVAIVDTLTAAEYAPRGLVVRPLSPRVSFEIYLLRPRHAAPSALTERLIADLRSAAGAV